MTTLKYCLLGLVILFVTEVSFLNDVIQWAVLKKHLAFIVDISLTYINIVFLGPVP